MRRLDVDDEWWLWKIVHWSKGSISPYELRYEWTFLDVLCFLDVLDAMDEIEFVSQQQ